MAGRRSWRMAEASANFIRGSEVKLVVAPSSAVEFSLFWTSKTAHPGVIEAADAAFRCKVRVDWARIPVAVLRALQGRPLLPPQRVAHLHGGQSGGLHTIGKV